MARILASRSVIADMTLGDAVPVAIVSTSRFSSASIRIVQNPGYSPGGQQRNLFAVHSGPVETPFVPVFGVCSSAAHPSHHLFHVIILSSEIPVTRRIGKESVKVRTPESPASADKNLPVS